MANLTSDRLDIVAKRYGGYRTFYFRQGDMVHAPGLSGGLNHGAVFKAYKDFTSPKGKTLGGVCATVCAYWTVFHANQDNDDFKGGISSWEYMFKGGPKMDPSVAYEIATEHALSYGNQVPHLISFMREFDVKERTTAAAGGSMTNTFLPFSAGAQALVDHITGGGGGYKLLSMKRNVSGTGGGHMVCAYWDWGDVVFMDPNFGEFWLPNADSFKSWLRTYFFMAYLSDGVQKYKSMRPYHFVKAS